MQPLHKLTSDPFLTAERIIITAFVVATAVGTVLTGWLSRLLGRRKVFLVSSSNLPSRP